MTEENNVSSQQEADIKKMNSISRIWLVPIVALSIGLWMVYYQWSNQGPLITIEFSSAAGIEPGNTKIKTRDVEIGIVKKVELKPDLSGVFVTARINPTSSHLLREFSKFWIVTPRISLGGVSGLQTLLSGPYIAMEPSDSGEEQYHFIAFKNPPVTPAGTPGLHITLNSDDEFAFKEGDPIIYKGLKVGEFEDIYFNIEERIVYYNAFIKAPYHKLITQNTKFWNTSGVRFELEASGIKVQTAALETLLTNGVTFGIPEGMPAGQQITERAFFDIFEDYETASDERYKLGVNFIVLIDETVRGLQVGAPVEYRGLVIGEVVEVNLQGPNNQTILEDGYSIPILISIQPSRVHLPDNQIGVEKAHKQIMLWINQGLRASLKMGNLLTGALYVDLQHYEVEEPIVLTKHLGYDTIPVRSGELAQITQKITAVLDTINELPLKELSENANRTLNELNDTISSFHAVANRVDNTLEELDLGGLRGDLHTTLNNINKVMADYSDGSRGHDELLNSMVGFQRTLKELTPLLQQLNRSPNSLIFTNSLEPQIEPKARDKATQGTNNE